MPYKKYSREGERERKRIARIRKRLREGRNPLGHPEGCCCYDCLFKTWEPEPEHMHEFRDPRLVGTV